MPVRKTTRRTPAKRKTAVRRTAVAAPKRRTKRRTMGQPFSKANIKSGSQLVVKGAVGGALAQVVSSRLSNVVEGILPGAAKNYASAVTVGIAAYLTKTMAKQAEIAAGMAGVAGAELAKGFGLGAAHMGQSFEVMPGESNENFYAMSEALPLSGYETPMSEGVYSSGYANMYA
jgi:hypothetical protein